MTDINNADRHEPEATPMCTWCEKVHENPVRINPFALGGLARSMGAEAFGASCDLINQRASEL